MYTMAQPNGSLIGSPFCMANATFSLYVTLRHLITNLPLSTGGFGPPFNTSFLGPPNLLPQMHLDPVTVVSYFVQNTRSLLMDRQTS